MSKLSHNDVVVEDVTGHKDVTPCTCSGDLKDDHKDVVQVVRMPGTSRSAWLEAIHSGPQLTSEEKLRAHVATIEAARPEIVIHVSAWLLKRNGAKGHCGVYDRHVMHTSSHPFHYNVCHDHSTLRKNWGDEDSLATDRPVMLLSGATWEIGAGATAALKAEEATLAQARKA